MILEHGYHCRPRGGAATLREQLAAYDIEGVYVRICGVVGDCVAVIPNQRYRVRTVETTAAARQELVGAITDEVMFGAR